MTKKPKILLIYTGGTIGMVKDYTTDALKAFDFNHLHAQIPELNLLSCHIETISFKEPIDSSNMNIENYLKVVNCLAANYEEHDGFVILTGSDTMAYTASALSFMIENLQKPVIFTGSQLPIGDLRTDAKENLITAIQIASARTKTNEPEVTEVGLYFEYKLYRANRTSKINAEQFEAFSSLNYPAIAESGVHLKFNTPFLWRSTKGLPVKFHKALDNRIAILKLFPGITKQVVSAILRIEDLQGVVLETYGSGNAPTEPWFLTLLEEALRKGVKIVDVTQCIGGSVILGQYETSVAMQKMGVISGKDITTESAVAKMMFLLGQKTNNNDFRGLFETSLRGELQ